MNITKKINLLSGLSDLSYCKEATVIQDNKYSIFNKDNYTYSPLEQKILNVCNRFNIEVSLEEISDKTSFCKLKEISYLIESKDLNCDLLANLSIVQKVQRECSYSDITTMSEKECIFAYQSLTADTNCGLTLSQYKNYIAMGFTPESISSIYNSNFRLTEKGDGLESSLINLSFKDELCFNDVTLSGIGNISEFLNKALVGVPETIISEIIASYG